MNISKPINFIHESSQQYLSLSQNIEKKQYGLVALKVATYILSVGIFPLIALAIRAAGNYFLRTTTQDTDSQSEDSSTSSTTSVGFGRFNQQPAAQPDTTTSLAGSGSDLYDSFLKQNENDCDGTRSSDESSENDEYYTSISLRDSAADATVNVPPDFDLINRETDEVEEVFAISFAPFPPKELTPEEYANAVDGLDLGNFF